MSKTKLLLLPAIVFMFFSQSAHAQILIEDPLYGTVVQTRKVLSTAGGLTSVQNTSYSTTSGALAVANSSTSISTGTDSSKMITYNLANGIIEFELDSFDAPESMTAQNFTVRLMGLAGTPDDTDDDLSIDLYTLAPEQRDGLINKYDFHAITGDAAPEGPFKNGLFPQEGIDVTEQLRAALFGDDTDNYAGFIMIPGDAAGLTKFKTIENATLKFSIDTAGDTDTDTDTVIDSESEQEFDSSEDTDNTGIDDPDVSCSCRAAGAASLVSIFRILFP